MTIKTQLIRLGSQRPELRTHIRPILDVLKMSSTRINDVFSLGFLDRQGIEDILEFSTIEGLGPGQKTNQWFLNRDDLIIDRRTGVIYRIQDEGGLKRSRPLRGGERFDLISLSEINEDNLDEHFDIGSLAWQDAASVLRQIRAPHVFIIGSRSRFVTFIPVGQVI